MTAGRINQVYSKPQIESTCKQQQKAASQNWNNIEVQIIKQIDLRWHVHDMQYGLNVVNNGVSIRANTKSNPKAL